MDEEILEAIGQLAEKSDNSLFASQTMTSLPPSVRVIGLSGTLREVRDELIKLYKRHGGTETLNIQA